MPGREPTVVDVDGAVYHCTLDPDAPGHLTYTVHAGMLRVGAAVKRACRVCRHPMLRIGDGRNVVAQICPSCDLGDG